MPLYTHFNLLFSTITKLLFPAAMLWVTTDIIKSLNTMFYHFLWDKRDKISRSVTYNPVSKGGLNIPNFKKFFMSLQAGFDNTITIT